MVVSIALVALVRMHAIGGGIFFLPDVPTQMENSGFILKIEFFDEHRPPTSQGFPSYVC